MSSLPIRNKAFTVPAATNGRTGSAAHCGNWSAISRRTVSTGRAGGSACMVIVVS